METHGELTLRWEGDILRAQAEGLFNEEGALAGARKYQEVVSQSTKPGGWAQLECWGEGALGAPEVFVHVSEAYRWNLEHGCCAIALVVFSAMQSDIAERMISAPFKVFFDEGKAREWLLQQMASQS